MNGSARAAAGRGVTWESASARSQEVNGYPSYSSRNQGFFFRHARKLSTSLPTFSMGSSGGRRDYSDREKLGRGRWPAFNASNVGRLLAHLGRMLWRFRLRVGIVLGIILAFVLFYCTRQFPTLSCLWDIQCPRTWRLADNDDSSTPKLPSSILARRWQQICNHTGSESRRWSDGVERPSGMGH